MTNKIRLLLVCGVALGVMASVAVAGRVSVFGGARFDSKAWTKLQAFDVRALRRERALDSHVGHVVEVHFQFRSKDVRQLKPNWYQAAVWQTAQDGKRGFVNVPVMLISADVNAFKELTSDPRATADLKVYGQVLYDLSMNYAFLRLIGTNTFVDGDGYTNVTW